MRVTSLVSALAVLLLFTVHEGAAQSTPKHQGYWISFGLGLGWNLSNTIDGKAKGGGAGFLRMGGTPSQRLLVGGEVIGFATRDDDVDYGRGNLHAVVVYYLNLAQGLYVKGGVGAASFTTSVTDGNTTTATTDAGFGAGAGIGWDVKLGRNFYLTPALDVLYQRVSVGANPATDNLMTLLTLGVTWH